MSLDFQEKILLVDDEETILLVEKNILSSFQVITAINGEEALMLLRKHKDIFLIISDFKMPVMDGRVFLQNAKEEFPEIPFYILTGYGDKDLVVSLFENKLDGYLDKPFKSSELVELATKMKANRLSQLEEEEEVLQLFLDDANQNIEELDYKTSCIKENPENIKDIKRLLHTMKGSASFIKKMDQIGELSHKAEDMIKGFLDKGLALSDEGSEVLLCAIDFLRGMIVELRKNKTKRFELDEILLKLSLKELDASLQVKEKIQKKDEEERKSEGIFIQSSKLDALMDQAGNLIVLRNLLHEHITSFNNASKNSNDKLKDIFQELDSISSHLHNEISQIRKVTLLSILKPYHRFIRELSSATGKRLVLRLFDNGIFVDKDAGKYLSDSLVHLIRNSADHGIEDKEERVSLGKAQEGHITISASESVDGIRVSIEDDGRGINSQVLVEKALKKGLINETNLKNMTEEEKLELIFFSGFSTAKKVTKISGRGEGMDIVKDALSKVRGVIKVSSTLNKGTKFQIDIPHAKSVNIINALIVSIKNNYFAVPTELVKKIMRLDSVHVTKANSKKFIQDGDSVLRLVSLEEFVDLSHLTVGKENLILSKNEMLAVVFSSGMTNYGLVVDDVVGQLQVVYKRFDRYVGKIPSFKGTTLLKDGRPCLVFDLEWICNFLGRDMSEESSVS